MPASYEPSINSQSSSIRGSIIGRWKARGYQLTPTQSDTDSTMTGIPGPGCILGSLISRGGRRLESAIDRFAEEQLGLGPTAAARRLTAALHDIHIAESPDCAGRDRPGIDSSSHETDKLICVCNGYCSRCDSPYLPRRLAEPPGSVLKPVLDLRRYLLSSNTPANVGLASIYVCILVESCVMTRSLLLQLDVLAVMQKTREAIWPSYVPCDPIPDDLIALKAAIAAVHEATDHDRSPQPDSVMRFEVEELKNAGSKRIMYMALETLDRVRSHQAWTSKEIESAQLLVKLSTWSRDNRGVHFAAELQKILISQSRMQSLYEMPLHLTSHVTKVCKRAAAVLPSTTTWMLRGHEKSVLSVAWTPDGTRLISGSYDETVRVWNPRAARQVAELEGHASSVFSVAVSPDGAMYATGSSDTHVRLWEAKTGSMIASLKGHTDSVHSVAFSPDGARIASGSWDGTIRLWDTKTGLESAGSPLEGHTAGTLSIVFSPDMTCIAAASGDDTVRLWDLRSGEQTAMLRGHTAGVQAVAFSPNGEVIASGSRDQTIRLWDASSGREIRKLNGHTSHVLSVAFAPDGAHLVSASFDYTVQVWDVHSGQEIAVLWGHEGYVYCAVFSPDGNYVASGSDDGTIRVWDVSILRSMNRERFMT